MLIIIGIVAIVAILIIGTWAYNFTGFKDQLMSAFISEGMSYDYANHLYHEHSKLAAKLHLNGANIKEIVRIVRSEDEKYQMNAVRDRLYEGIEKTPLQRAFLNLTKLSEFIQKEFPISRLDTDRLWHMEFINTIGAFILNQRDVEDFEIEETSRGRDMFAPNIGLAKTMEYCDEMIKTFHEMPNAMTRQEFLFYQFWPSIYKKMAKEILDENKKS